MAAGRGESVVSQRDQLPELDEQFARHLQHRHERNCQAEQNA